MLLYNVTVQIDRTVEADWLDWMQATHIPDVLATGCFLSGELFRLIDGQEDHTTYAVQYRCRDMETLHRYQEVFAPDLQAAHRQRYEGRFAAFRSLLEEVIG